MKKLKNNKAITLIALIITIVVLLILAVVAINSVKDGGILSHAKSAQQTYKDAADNETTKMSEYLDYLNTETEKAKIENNGNISESKEVKIGDYVNYQAGISTYNDTNGKGWRVLGIDDGKVLLVSTDIIKNDYELRGGDAYINGVKYLNDICEPYGYGKGAEGARSITVEDVNKLTGYDPNNIGLEHNGGKYNQGEFSEYLNNVTYSVSNDEIVGLKVKALGKNGKKYEGRKTY